MTAVFTCIARVKDWKALQEINRTALLKQARETGARRFQIYRNVSDASQALIVAEFPDHDALREMRRVLSEQMAALSVSAPPDDRAWEPTGWEGIGEEGGEPPRPKT
jgi:hypothetical protein